MTPPIYEPSYVFRRLGGLELADVSLWGWETLALPEGKVILPGVVSHATNGVEHPELVADRIVRFAEIVGPRNVIASTDCGLGGRVHPQIAWAKLGSLVHGAALASQRLGA